MQIGELANKLTNQFATEYNEFDWKNAYKLRNIIGHDYEKLSTNALYQAGKYASTKLYEYTEKIITKEYTKPNNR